MVQLMSSGLESVSQRRKIAPVKVEVDSAEYEHGRLNKRSKPSSPLPFNLGPDSFPVPPSHYNPLEEPSPLGLRLRKSPSLLDLIQMTLSKENLPEGGSQAMKEHKASSSSGTIDKLKASNFPASFLRIGTWEYKSRHEGDLVAKCYFAKHKIVWEVLDGGLKNKIEIQWSDIMALKANYPDDKPGTLDVVLARQPLFFRETNPQPRKHTLWQASSDFTGGQASINRRHFLQCPQGLLGKHFEKLIQCDPRLNFLSQQAETVLETPYFEPRISVFGDSKESNHEFDSSAEERQGFFDMGDAASPSGVQSSSLKSEQHDLVGRPPEQFYRDTPSPSSETHSIKEIRISRFEELKALIEHDQIKVPTLNASLSMNDLVSHFEHRISEQRTSNNFSLSAEERQSLEILEEISRCLFSDSQYASTSDEQCIMSRVDSLCCLLQKDSAQVHSPDFTMDDEIGDPNSVSPFSSEDNIPDDFDAPKGEHNNVSDSKPAMSRKDSVGELLLNLPRIASLPRFLFNISEDYNRKAR